MKPKEKTALGEKLPFSQKIGALMAATAAAVATGYVPNYINVYYTDTVGVSIGAIGLILMLMKITDGVTDIMMGMIVDRTRTKLGKARPWLLAGGFGLAISMLLLFSCPPKFSMAGKIAFCAFFYFLVNPFFGTMVSVTASAVINLISGDSKHRAVLGVFSSYGSLLPVLVIGLVVPTLLSAMGENQKTYTMVTLVFVLMAVVATVVAVACIRETVSERSMENLTEKQPVMESIKELLKNKYFVYLALGTICYNLTAAPVANYYAKYIFGDIGKATLINLPGLLMVFLLPFAIPLVNKIGKRNSIVIGLGMCVVGHAIMFFANTNLVVFMIGKTIAGISPVPYFVALIPLTGEICDYALYKSGKPMDGTISSAASMGGKIGIGLTAGISSLMLQFAGYISSADEVFAQQPDSALFMLRILIGVYPAILFALAAFFFWKIDLEKQGIAQIQQELREKGLR